MSRVPKIFRKPRFLLVYPLVAWMFICARTTETTLRAGILLVALGELLRLWANGYIGDRKVNFTPTGPGAQKIGHLMTAGPYRFVRHPLYLGSFLLGAGFGIITGHGWFTAAALLLLLLVYRRTIAEEEIILHREWGERFERYRQAVPQLFPLGRRYADGGPGRWRWQGIAASQEWKTALWVVVTVIALYFREEWGGEHEWFEAPDRVKHIILLCLVAALIVGDVVFEAWKRQARLPALQKSA